MSILLYPCCENDMPQSLAVLFLSDNPRTSWRSLADSSVEVQRLPWGSPGRINTRLLSKLMNLSNLVDHLLCKTLYFCNQAWFNWILLGNPCPVTATKEPRFRVRSVLDPAGHGEHPETPMDLPWSRFSNFQPLKHEDISNAVWGCIQYIGSTVLFPVIASKMNVLP